MKAEIKLKGTLVDLMKGRNVPTLIIRSIDQKQVSVLAELGLKIPSRSGEIDLTMTYASGDVLTQCGHLRGEKSQHLSLDCK